MAKGSTEPRLLGGGAHRVYRLAPDLLLVFKPRGHCEGEHAHERAQRLRVLRGKLTVRMGRTTRTLKPGGATFTVPARRSHRTESGDDTWLVVEWVGSALHRNPR
jgi:quercetin dioxygenase-like cupin family protein